MGERVVAEKMVFGGNCIAKVNGKTLFIPDAIPGETLEVEITASFRDYDIAKIIQIVEPSAQRVQPFCPLYGICGGCTMQHVSATHQRELRMRILQDCFAREGITVPDIRLIAGDERGYRARIQLTDGGFNRRGSNTVVPLTTCPVATPQVNAYLASVPQSERPRGRCHVFGDARVQNATPFDHLIVAEEKKHTQPVMSEKVRKRIKHRVPPRFAGTMPGTQSVCSVLLAGKTVHFDTHGFFQSNLAVLEQTVGVLMQGLNGSHALDMYAGAGIFSVFLSDCFEHVTLVEHNRDALVQAERNLAGKSHESYGVSGEKWVRENATHLLTRQGDFDAVVIDPPRSGMEKAVRDWLCAHKVAHIRSLSCDPATHARDAAALIHAGYAMTALYLLDFYPQTSHIESLAFFESHAT